MTPAPLLDAAAEAATLGAVLVDAGAMDELAEVLEPTHFGRAHHGVMFDALRRLHQAGEPLDLVTLTAELARVGQLDACGGAAAVARLTDGMPRRANVLAYARVIRDRYLLRTLRGLAQDLVAACERDDARGADVLLEAESAVFAVAQTAVRADWVSGAELSQELFGVLETLAAAGPVSGVPSGFGWLDQLTRGWQPGDLVVVGARPGMGKTSFALQVALHAAQTVPVAFFSLEMARQPIGLRGVAATAQVDGLRLFGGKATTDVEYGRISQALGTLAAAQIHLDESPALSPLHARSKLRRLRARLGTLGLVVVDYLQLMTPLPEHRRENRTTQVGGISRALKVLARELSVPVIALSQLNRDTTGRADKRPTLSDLRESGAIEQDADVVLLLHRPGYYDATVAEPDLAEVILAKQRNGPTGAMELTWHATHMRFENRRRD